MKRYVLMVWVLLMAGNVWAQRAPNVYPPVGGPYDNTLYNGYVGIVTQLRVPNDTGRAKNLCAPCLTNPRYNDTGSIAYKAGAMWWYTGTQWTAFGSGGGGSSFTLTTTGTTGAATFAAGVLNIPQYTMKAGKWLLASNDTLSFDSAGVVALDFTSPDNRHLPTTTAVNNLLNVALGGVYSSINARVQIADSGTKYVTPYDFDSVYNYLLGVTEYLDDTKAGYVDTADLLATKTYVQTQTAGKMNVGDSATRYTSKFAGDTSRNALWATKANVSALAGYVAIGDSATRYTSKYAGDTSRNALWATKANVSALAGYVAIGDSATRFTSKYAGDTSRLSLWAQTNLRQLINDTGTWDATRAYVLTGTYTMSNKTINTSRWVPRVDSITSNANPVINTDNVSYYEIKAQAANANITTTGTPRMGDQLCVCWTGTGSFTMTFNTSSFENGAQTLPTAITTTKVCAVFLYNTISLRWRFAGTF